MTAIFKDFEEVYSHYRTDGNGIDFSGPGQEQELFANYRITIDATDRDEWQIVNVATLQEDASTKPAREIEVPLQGDNLKKAIAFFDATYTEELQDAVNLQILESGEQVWA